MYCFYDVWCNHYDLVVNLLPMSSLTPTFFYFKTVFTFLHFLKTCLNQSMNPIQLLRDSHHIWSAEIYSSSLLTLSCAYDRGWQMKGDLRWIKKICFESFSGKKKCRHVNTREKSNLAYIRICRKSEDRRGYCKLFFF